MAAELDGLYQSMAKRLEQLRGEGREPEEMLAFYARVLRAQQQAQQQTAWPRLNLPDEQLRLRLEEGFALIEREAFPIDATAALQLFGELCRLCQEENLVLAEAGKRLLEASTSGRLDFGQLIKAVLRDESEKVGEMAAELEVKPAILQALAKLSLQPSLFAVQVAAARRTSLDSWRQGYCPICGSLPAMAVLVGEEGRREALCSFCGRLWRLPRLGCPFCSTADHEKLRYFYGEGEENYRVQVCEQCRGYLKILDCRKAGLPEALAVEDIATAHLDLLAEQQGYERKAPRLWGI